MAGRTNADEMLELVRLHIAVKATVRNPVMDMQLASHLSFRDSTLLTATFIAITGLPGLDLPIPPSSVPRTFPIEADGKRFFDPSPGLTTGDIAEL
jgi:hypothetical protein|tara:strand:+ start:500 stop:787 length:288 start_codon:yes stop_codon:yes gene_type:complete